jgi:hypothetical protein
MRREEKGQPRASLMTRLIGSQRPIWLTVAISLLLILAPLALAYLDGSLEELLQTGSWRPAMLPSVVIVYIFVIGPLMARRGEDVVEAFRPLVQLDDEEFDRLIAETSRRSPVGEAIALAVGAGCGILIGRTWAAEAEGSWLVYYIFASLVIMFLLLGWIIYSSMAGTRQVNELHRQPLRIDIFDIEPFEPIGRESLILALVFVGGIALSLLFGMNPSSILDWRNWIVYFVLIPVPFLVFFLNMRGTHRVLAAEKKRESEAVELRIRHAYRTLMAQVEAGQDTGRLAPEILALVEYERRVQGTRTWPYNTTMIRTLFFSFIVPAAVALADFAFKQITQ